MPVPNKKEVQFREGDLIKANHLLFGQCLALIVSIDLYTITESWAKYKFLFIILTNSTNTEPWNFSYHKRVELAHFMAFNQWSNPLLKAICIQYSNRFAWQFYDSAWIEKEKIFEITSKCQLQNQINLFQFLNPSSIIT